MAYHNTGNDKIMTKAACSIKYINKLNLTRVDLAARWLAIFDTCSQISLHFASAAVYCPMPHAVIANGFKFR